MKSLLTFLTITVFTFNLSAQNFEGTIEFKKVKNGKTSTYIYYVQGDFVRLEEYGSKKTITDLAVINLKEEKVYLLSPERKTYMIVNTTHSTKDMSKTKVEMTKTTKTVLGKSCKKWVVSNTDLNASVTYWVTEGHYDFFVKLLSTLRRKDYSALFYQQVPAAMGYLPMISIWTNLDGVEIERFEVVNIDERVLRGNFFHIPADYTEFKN